MRYVIQKLGTDVKSIVLKFPSDQTISLRIINEKQKSTAGEILSKWQTFIQNLSLLYRHVATFETIY